MKTSTRQPWWPTHFPAFAVIERSFRAWKSGNWIIVMTGFAEPLLYLTALGLGMGALVGEVPGPNGVMMSYAAFIAPAMMTTSAMNGAIYDSTWNVFFKMNFAKLYETMLATSLAPFDVAIGEIAMALFRGLIYALGFGGVIAAMGLTSSWWALAMVPVAVLIALGFAAFGMAITSYFTRFQQMELLSLVILPMFLFSATLVPLEVFPTVAQWFIVALPLWHGVELMRQLSLGVFTSYAWIHLSYFVVLSVAGIIFTTRRLRSLFLR
ncbi:MAG: ABC transporter permease [Propionibacteriaceae bacterium]|jgi:lipooligosaccharide transport system permease protein|nr:ABC transporter permease [Propionibacteriaceae bacterium]